MPLTQEKRLDSTFSNNNDHSYLHKKFKKMASTISVFPTNSMKDSETRYKETTIAHSASNSSITNSSIAAAHPEIEKIKHRESPDVNDTDKNVQISYKDSNMLGIVNNIVHVSGHTSFTDEFSNKTETPENELIREAYNGGTGGRYICPYCKLSCAKPSVLQKHIRAHTNERPYPCVPCGFAFKTKSNLYKHRRSRSHALRLQGADVSVQMNEEDLSGGSESDTSIPPTSVSDTGSEPIWRSENSRPNEFSSPELMIDSSTLSMTINASMDNSKSKTIYKPKFRAALYQESDEKDKIKKTISQNADFLTEHISKIISDNEAIVDVIETPLQKKYGKIKQIAESKQFLNENIDFKHDQSPLNLTKNSDETESSFRKRSHSEGLSHLDYQKHPLNPEGSIIKDLLLKTKANGITSITGEIIDGLGPLFVCPVCQIIYRSADNLEVHRLYYCKGSTANPISTITNVNQKDVKVLRPENMFVRSNSVNVRLPETPTNSYPKSNKSPPLRSKPDNLVIMKQESNDVVTPLPSPGPLLGNTRLVDTKAYSDNNRKPENFKTKPLSSPKRKLDSRSDTFSPRSLDSMSPRSTDLYPQSKIRCIETTPVSYRSLEDMSQHMRHNSTSLQMFGGEVKIVDHLGSTTTLRIEPSKNQLSPIIVQQNLSPSRLVNDSEASSIFVRSGLHSGGTMVHNPPTPKDMSGTSQAKTPRILVSNATGMSNITHFQFPPLSAITAYNPLTLPPMSPAVSPSGASTILHGGKLIPHVPGMPGPNSPGLFITTSKVPPKNTINDGSRIHLGQNENVRGGLLQISNVESANTVVTSRYEISRSPMRSISEIEKNKQLNDTGSEAPLYAPTIPVIRIKNVDEANNVTRLFSISPAKLPLVKQDGALKKFTDVKTPLLKENINGLLGKTKTRDKSQLGTLKTVENKSDVEVRNFNFENLITKSEIYNQISSSSEVQKKTNAHETPAASIDTNERSETSYFQKNNAGKSGSDERKSKFLRPSTLPLKPGTFTPKRHHGITPNANTMPLVSPETPRPAKAYGQLYLNGNAYTYLGLKCSTKVFYCTINRPQPTYVPNQHFLSMYSNWQLLSELTPDPLGLSASSAMSLYDSRHRPQCVAVAVIKQDLILTHSSQWNKNSKDSKQAISLLDLKKSEDNKVPFDCNATPKKELTGGFESNEEYTYVRGRGRGRYVCSECGIRCKKPSMLKKHIRTHTDVRPYTCTHCAFSFKTKGNLTKHMKSKAHYKKCCELGINPNEGNEDGSLNSFGDSDDDTESDGDEGNEGETESSDTEPCKSRLPEHEAAHCLLSLGGSRQTNSSNPGLITSARPSTYPYTPTGLENATLDLSTERMQVPLNASTSVESKMDIDNEPMDLSKSEVKTLANIPEKIATARESSVLACLASNTAKLPQQHTQWSNGEPMLHTYLTERALLDSKIKQSQLACNNSKLRKIDIDKPMYTESGLKSETQTSCSNTGSTTTTASLNISSSKVANSNDHDMATTLDQPKTENIPSTITVSSAAVELKKQRTLGTNNAENAKHVVSEYLKHARINIFKSQVESASLQNENTGDDSLMNTDETVGDEKPISDEDAVKLPLDHDPIARKVVIGIGGVAFKVTKGKDFEGGSYSTGRLMEDGRRVCDFCNKTFTKPSQLRLHLNIHYMERPFRCSVCAVSFRTRGHLQKHERSGSHHNKVSMTSTFGAATSFNPRPFRCSDCNIAFRIHGHLAKHLRSKMHVMRLECLFKLPFGTFTEIERAGVSLTDIDTTDCASSLASLQSLARKLHEKDPTKLEFREGPPPPPSSEDEEGAPCERGDGIAGDSADADGDGDTDTQPT